MLILENQLFALLLPTTSAPYMHSMKWIRTNHVRFFDTRESRFKGAVVHRGLSSDAQAYAAVSIAVRCEGARGAVTAPCTRIITYMTYQAPESLALLTACVTIAVMHITVRSSSCATKRQTSRRYVRSYIDKSLRCHLSVLCGPFTSHVKQFKEVRKTHLHAISYIGCREQQV